MSVKYLMPHEELQYWNFNLPQSQLSSECPEYLLNLNDKDRRLIESWDNDYQIQDWPKVQELVRTNRIDLFQRYRQFIFNIIQEYGSVMKFILRTRLHWNSVVPASIIPFADPADVKTFYND